MSANSPITSNSPITGKVRRKQAGSNYGFISAHEGFDIYVHRSGMAAGCSWDDISEGTEVTFQVYETKERGNRAIEVRPA